MVNLPFQSKTPVAMGKISYDMLLIINKEIIFCLTDILQWCKGNMMRNNRTTKLSFVKIKFMNTMSKICWLNTIHASAYKNHWAFCIQEISSNIKTSTCAFQLLILSKNATHLSYFGKLYHKFLLFLSSRICIDLVF